MAEITNIAKNYTPAEFAALYKRHPSWGYRRIYSGAVEILQDHPSLLIPQEQVDKFNCRTVPHVKARKSSREQRRRGVQNVSKRDPISNPKKTNRKAK